MSASDPDFDPDFDTEEMGALTDAVVQLSFAVMAHLTQVGVGYELSLTQLRLLGILRDREPRMSELAERLGLDRSSVSGLVDRAVTRGLVERVADPDDGRASRVRLTTDGRALARHGATEMAAHVTRLTAELDPDQRRTLRRLLELAQA